MAREFGIRAGDFDELAPAEEQPDPRVRHAMQLLQACAAGRAPDTGSAP